MKLFKLFQQSKGFQKLVFCILLQKYKNSGTSGKGTINNSTGKLNYIIGFKIMPHLIINDNLKIKNYYKHLVYSSF
jgi:hypothetical protein